MIEKNTTKATNDKVLIDNLKILKLNKKSKKIRKSKDTFIIRQNKGSNKISVNKTEKRKMV